MVLFIVLYKVVLRTVDEIQCDYSNMQSAIFALSGSAVPKSLLRDVNRAIISLLLDDWRQSSKFGRHKLASWN